MREYSALKSGLWFSYEDARETLAMAREEAAFEAGVRRGRHSD